MKLSTVMAREKTLTRVRAVHLESGEEVIGYEIHHGQTVSDDAQPVIRSDDGEIAGLNLPAMASVGELICTAYSTPMASAMVHRQLRKREGAPRVGKIAGRYDLEPAFDRLADAVRAGVKMDFIYRQLGL